MTLLKIEKKAFIMPVAIEPNQYTLQRTVRCQGVGLHSGRAVRLVLRPAPADTGIRFRRTDVEGRSFIPARADQVVDTTLATTIGDGRNSIATIEHLMAALRGTGIDNAIVEVDAPEVPIMDGSAGPFLKLLEQGSRRRQRARRRILRITRPVSYSDGAKSIRIEPYAGFKISGCIHFDDALIGEQRYSVDLTPERFARELASARTFGFVEQVEQLWQNGLALGGTLDSVIAIHWDRRSILNEDGLRFENEFIRHKLLDLVGDLALLGAPLLGHVIANRSGHGLHLGLMQTLLHHPDCWEYVRYQKKGNSLFPQAIHAERHGGRPASFPVSGDAATPAIGLAYAV